MDQDDFNEDALIYHSEGKPGKVDVQSSKKCSTEYDLSLAYSPGVAAPCKAIAKDKDLAYKYTTKGNLVAVISNGSAVLGLGNIGPLAGKPVMEGKGVLFKQFAGIDVFDIELETQNSEEFIQAVKAMAPTFGGINLEDIAAPDCFVIEKRLKAELDIPVFHDDQHGTAIICGAALINACKITGKKIEKIKVVFNGAGASATACAKLFFQLGVQPSNLLICDSKGVIQSERTDLNEYKQFFSRKTSARTLTDALNGADVFCGLSVGGVLKGEMLKAMAKNPIVFAMANPDPEICPKEAKSFRDDIIMATGRSDFPNQVNNVLGFPSIFRGALDTRSREINSEMKLAAVHALAELAREDVPESVSSAYDGKNFHFGPEYIIPKPFDPRVLIHVSSAVAKAAMDSGVARVNIENFQDYKAQLETQQSFKRGFVRSHINRVQSHLKKRKASAPILVFPEGQSIKLLKALNSVVKENIITPILLGYEENIQKKIKKLDLDHLKDIRIINPSKDEKYQEYVEKLCAQRNRRGVTFEEARRLMKDPSYFSAMMVKENHAQGLISGISHNYLDCVRPILQIIGRNKPYDVASGLIIILFKDKIFFLADTTVNINPTAEQIASIAIQTSKVAGYFNHKPRIAMLSYSNFTGKGASPQKMKEAGQIVKKIFPDMIVDGEMQADTAVNSQIVDQIFPFCEIKNGANVLIFPDLNSGNIAYKLIQQLSKGEVLGPFLMGVSKPANVLQRSCSVEDIFNAIVLTSLQSEVLNNKLI